LGGGEGAENMNYLNDKVNYCLNKGEDFVLKSILNEGESAKFYSFIADYTTSIFHSAFVM